MLNEYIALDIETTGLSTKEGARIVWISGLKIKNKQVVGECFYKIKTGANISEFFTNLIGIKQSDLKDSPPPILVLPEFFRFAQGLPMVCHNAAFVQEFMESECRNRNYHGFLTYHCIFEMAQKTFPGERNSIDSLFERLNLKDGEINGHFRSDAKKVFLVYERLKN
jgi:DNA polymerase-3 subunit epsilon